MYRFLLLTFLVSSFAQANDFQVFQNLLQPFTSDGCSNFPDGIGKLDWQQCCVQHDSIYWKGGTEEEKFQADEELKMCVAEKSHLSLGTLMEIGVRIGGISELPTSWRWGYGWVVNRGYRSLGDFELNQVNQLLPESLTSISLLSIPSIVERPTVTGNYCLDIALTELAEIQLEDQVFYKIINETSKSSPNGTIKSFSILTSQCLIPYKVDFLLLREQACLSPVSELVARGRVRLQSISEGCLD